MFEALNLWDNSNDYRMTAWRRVQNAGAIVKGKVIVVTGATGALGKELVSAFVKGGATVVMTGRSMSKAEKVKQQILQAILASEEANEEQTEENAVGDGDTNIVPMLLDLGDFDSIEKFVKDLKSKFPQGIQALVNNAGMIANKYQLTKHGIETSLQANFVSQVLLTELLLPHLTPTDDGFAPRIVNMSSLGHADPPNPIDWNVIPSTSDTFKGGYNKEYFEGKWLLTAYTSHLARRSLSILAVSADPGMSPDSAMWEQVVLPVRLLARYVFKPLMKSSPQAAACAAHLAVVAQSVENGLVPGGYYQSGVLLEKPLRSDCSDVDEWRKAVALLEQLLPNEYGNILTNLDS